VNRVLNVRHRTDVVALLVALSPLGGHLGRPHFAETTIQASQEVSTSAQTHALTTERIKASRRQVQNSPLCGLG
jgi:hypothetical protein